MAQSASGAMTTENSYCLLPRGPTGLRGVPLVVLKMKINCNALKFKYPFVDCGIAEHATLRFEACAAEPPSLCNRYAFLRRARRVNAIQANRPAGGFDGCVGCRFFARKRPGRVRSDQVERQGFQSKRVVVKIEGFSRNLLSQGRRFFYLVAVLRRGALKRRVETRFALDVRRQVFVSPNASPCRK